MTINNSALPVISGTPQQGHSLMTSNGQWTFDLDYLSYTYQWLRCDTAGANCVPIGGATASSYLLTGADVGSRLRSEVTATEHSNPTPGDPPAGYFWKGDFSADAQDFSDFDTHDISGTTFTDPTVGSTKDAVIVNKPVGAAYPWSNYSCRIICNNALPSNSQSGQTVNLWETGAYGAPWVNGNTVWCRAFILIPDGTNGTYPGDLTPIPGDGVSSSWHVLTEWHKNDGASAPGPTSTKLETAVYNGTPALIFKPIGGLSGSVRSWYLYETDQVQGPTNGAGGNTGPIGGNIIAMQFNHWYDMLWRWKLSPDPNVGEIDWYVDENLRVSGKFPNMFQKGDGTVPGISFQAGMYRNYPNWPSGNPVNHTNTTNANEIVYIGPMLSGPTRESVGA